MKYSYNFSFEYSKPTKSLLYINDCCTKTQYYNENQWGFRKFKEK